MATFFEGNTVYWWGVRDRVIYGRLTGDVRRSGNTVYLENMVFDEYDSNMASATGSETVSITVNGTTSSFVHENNGLNQWGRVKFGSRGINGTSFGVSTTQTSANVGWSTSDGYSGTFTVTFPSGATPPTGLNVTSLSTTQNTVTGTVSITGWGEGADSNRYLELSVSNNKTTDSRRYKAGTKGSTSTSQTLTVNNSSSGSMTISPNTSYYIGAYATNGKASTGVLWNWGSVVTKPATPTASNSNVLRHTATLTITAPAQGTAQTMTAYYKIGSGSWVNAGTIAQNSTKTVSLANLDANTAYTITVKVSNTSGDSATATTSFTTKPALYCSVSDKTKGVKKLYCSVNGKTKRVVKLYGSVNNKTKRII